MKVNGSAERCKQQRAGANKPTDSSGRGRHRQLDPIHLLCIHPCTLPIWRQRNPFHKRQRGCVFTEWRLTCVVMGEFVQAQCLHILYITSTCSVRVPLFVCVREDSPLRWLHNLTQGGGERAGTALGTVEEQSRYSHANAESMGQAGHTHHWPVHRDTPKCCAYIYICKKWYRMTPTMTTRQH